MSTTTPSEEPAAKRACSSHAEGESDKAEAHPSEAVAGASTDLAAPKGYEYLDHTADIQVRSWGATLEEAFEQQVVGMFGYMTELGGIELRETVEFEVSGHDNLSLLYALLDEFLFRFSAEDFMVCKEVKIVDFDHESFQIKVQGKGEPFDLSKHEQGTEIKAITYSNMQIHTELPTNDIYVILDI